MVRWTVIDRRHERKSSEFRPQVAIIRVIALTRLRACPELIGRALISNALVFRKFKLLSRVDARKVLPRYMLSLADQIENAARPLASPRASREDAGNERAPLSKRPRTP